MYPPRQDCQFRETTVGLDLGGFPFFALGMYTLVAPEGKTESVALFADPCGGNSVGAAGEYARALRAKEV